MAVSSWLFEKRPLKRAKLGPPDVYPQDPKQKEVFKVIIKEKCHRYLFTTHSAMFIIKKLRKCQFIKNIE